MLPGFHYRSGESRQVVKASLERDLRAPGAFWGRFPPRGVRNTANCQVGVGCNSQFSVSSPPGTPR